MAREATFWLLAVAAVASAFGVFRLGSMARVTFSLLASFLFVGGELILFGLAYLGVLVVLMMVMEMVIMAVFMIMFMMNPAGLMPMAMFHNKRGSLAISIATFMLLSLGILFVDWPARVPKRAADPTFSLGMALMGPKMLVMMVFAVTLLATMIAAVVLGAGRGRYQRYGDRLEREAPADPIRGGVGR